MVKAHMIKPARAEPLTKRVKKIDWSSMVPYEAIALQFEQLASLQVSKACQFENDNRPVYNEAGQILDTASTASQISQI